MDKFAFFANCCDIKGIKSFGMGRYGNLARLLIIFHIQHINKCFIRYILIIF